MADESVIVKVLEKGRLNWLYASTVAFVVAVVSVVGFFGGRLAKAPSLPPSSPTPTATAAQSTPPP